MAARLPPASRRKRSSSRAAIWSGESARSLAAASSIASGMPSSARQIRRTGRTVAVDGEPRPAGGRPVGEQPHGRVAERLRRSDLLVRHRQGPDRVQRLAGDAQRLAAGGEHPQARAARQEQVGEVRRRGDQMLAVVEHQQQMLVADRLHDALHRGHRAAAAAREQAELPGAEQRQDRARQVERVGDRRELDHPDAVGHVFEHARARLDRQPGLAGPTRSRERDQPPAGQKVLDPRDVVPAPHEAGDLRPQVRPRRLLRPRRLRRRRVGRAAAEDREMDGAELLGGIDAQLVRQPAAEALVGDERVRRSPRGRQRAHQLSVQPLTERVRGGQLVQLGDQGVARPGRQLGVDAVLGGAETQLLEPGDGRGREARVGGVGERRTSPQREPLAQQLARGQRVLGKPLAAGQRHPLEADRVDRLGLQREPVAGAVRLDHVGKQPAEPRDERLEGIGGRAGRIAVPDRVDELAGEHHPVGVQREPDQQRPQPRPDHGDGLAEADPQFERAENADSEIAGHASHSACPGAPVRPDIHSPRPRRSAGTGAKPLAGGSRRQHCWNGGGRWCGVPRRRQGSHWQRSRSRSSQRKSGSTTSAWRGWTAISPATSTTVSCRGG
jgi:hypothetical protein